MVQFAPNTALVKHRLIVGYTEESQSACLLAGCTFQLAPAVVGAQGWHCAAFYNPGALPEPSHFDAASFTMLDATIVFNDLFFDWAVKNAGLYRAAGRWPHNPSAVCVFMAEPNFH